MSSHEQEGLSRLHAEVIDDALPPAELLARYAQDPNGLEPAERRRVEQALARSPVVADELDTLRHFDFGALDADRAAGAAREGLLATVLGALLGRPQIWAAAAIVTAFVLWMGWPAGLEAPQRPRQEVAELPAPDVPAPAPAPIEPGAVDGPRELAHSPAPVPPLDPTPRLEPASEPQPPAPRVAHEEPPPPSPEPSLEEAPQEEILLAMAMPEYRPAFGTDPLGLQDWTTRSPGPDDVTITLATPNHVIRTSTRQPVLHWSLDRLPTSGSFHLAIVDRDDEPVVVDRLLPAPAAPGMQRLDLAALQLELPADRALRWSLALREGEDGPPRAFAFGWLRVSPLSPRVAEQIAASATPDRVALYAAAGCFHEALDVAIDTQARHPDDPRPRLALDSLLEQAGLEPGPAPKVR